MKKILGFFTVFGDFFSHEGTKTQSLTTDFADYSDFRVKNDA
jgi:hypothetical protein